jgi:hypothetical protein
VLFRGNFAPGKLNTCNEKRMIMSIISKFPTPPWDMENAAERLAFEEASWNSHNIDRILEGYASNAEIRDGVNFISGKEEFTAFLKSAFAEKQDYKLKLDLWGALKGRMAVRFEAEWRDASGQWYRSYGVQVFQFNDEGLAEKRYASQELLTIAAGQRELL